MSKRAVVVRAIIFSFVILIMPVGFAPPARAMSTPNPSGPPLQIVGGDGQRVVLDGSTSRGGIAGFAPLIVSLTAAGKPVANAPVKFTCAAPSGMACQLDTTGVGTPPRTVTTDANGIATLAAMGLNRSVIAQYSSGPISITASNGSASVTFALTVLPFVPPPSTPAPLIIVSGDGQKAARIGREGGLAYFGPLAVSVHAAGKPVARPAVVFTCVSKPEIGCMLEPMGQSHWSVTGDNNGSATLNVMQGHSAIANSSDGPFQITAAYGGAIVTFNLTVVPMVMTPSGDKQRVHWSGARTATFAPLGVTLGPTSGIIDLIPVTFTCSPPMGATCSFGTKANTITVNTNANAFASTPVTFTGRDGSASVTATAGTTSYVFALTILPLLEFEK